ncbi:Regulator of nonsense transcripts UPF3 [Colletotrichum spinosum]|uniref:Regulator of nonsense transcripts UPF3 n=1 Tax=Colletotrichum spinosum TaxID=1347390 RepID=A0A4R8QQ97_9PEZI|nr:Regulator of nonsense transcripts UPF3 [Colletotrichum spinosum]
MATSSTQSTSRKTNGALPVSSQQAATEAPKSNKSRTPVEGDKVVIRRLPPGLTEQELWAILGDEWKAGQGLVSWHNFVSGKISHDPAKTSRPARVYLHVLKRESIFNLSNLIQARSWEDAKMTSNNPCLAGPPVLEAATYPKIPSGKKRTDPRQGTIDQDAEFMAFLQEMTDPGHSKEADPSDSKESEESKPEAKVTTTPLIEYLKEKKANKAKEAAAAKSAKQARQEGTKGKGSASTAEESKKGKKDSRAEKSVDRPKETVKILTKKASAEAAKAAETVVAQIAQSSAVAQEAPKSRRAGIAAAARMLQRDLGISPGSAHRRARLDAAKAEADSKPTPSKEPAAHAPEATIAPVAAPAQSSSNASQNSDRNASSAASKSGRTRRGGGGKGSASDVKGKSAEAGNSSNASTPAKAPVVLLKKKDEEKSREKPEKADKVEKEPAASASQSAQARSNPPTAPKATGKSNNAKKGGGSGTVTVGATRGFVKHANPSQGVTEALLKQAMEAFGTVTFVEIDKRKGFAYVDFSDHDGLVKAVAASPVTVAQGTVQVLERKEKKPAASTANSSNANAGSSSSNAVAASSASASKDKDKEAAPAVSDKPEETRHKRTRRGRGGGKGGTNKDAQQSSASAEKTASTG